MAKSQSDRLEEALLRRIMRSPNVSTKGGAISVAKFQGFIRQSGSKLVLTKKGLTAARKAAKTLRKKGG